MTVRRASAALVIGVWSALWFVLLSRHGGVSWHYFADGGRIFTDVDSAQGGLHVYATRPDLQFGPVSVFFAALLLQSAGDHAMVVAQLITAVAGGAILVLARHLACFTPASRTVPVRDRTLFVAALAFIPVWLDLAVRFVHLDDSLALAFSVAALVCLRHRLWVVAALLLALGVDAKPWALPLVALLLVVPSGRRWATSWCFLGVVALAWGPFVISDPRTLTAASFQIPVDPSSSLYVLGLGDGGTPGWVRTVQVVLGLALTALAVHRRRWAAAILVVVLARLVVDPGVHSYYAAGVVVGALIWDVSGSRRLWPWWTTVSAGLLFAVRWLPQPVALHGWVTLLLFIAASTLVAAPISRAEPYATGEAEDDPDFPPPATNPTSALAHEVHPTSVHA